jgi:mannonate dehydratase
MTWRWFGEGNDSISLEQVRQIPGVGGIVWSLHDKVAGEEWEPSRIKDAVDQIHSRGFHAEVVESVNIHDSIKIGSPERDKYIEIYIDTIEKLSRVGVKVICYNFMPVFDWVRTDLYHPLPDGSNALFYEKAKAERDPRELIKEILDGAGAFTMPGWEPERLVKIEELLAAYRDIDEEKLTANLRYFLEAIIPTCAKCDVRMAVHPDDPPWPLYGLPRIVRSREHIRRYLAQVDSPYNGLTLCTGSLGANPANDIPAIIREFSDRIYFAHIRNVRHLPSGDFVETSHRTSDGSLDIREIVKTFHDVGFRGYVRPDHGRHLWGEEKTCRPGYGLYDRALGIMYLWGLWDAFEKGN